MTVNEVQGKNFVLFFFEGGVWIPYACSTSITFNIDTEFIETSVSGTGKNATFLPTKNSFTATADGIVALNETDNLTYPELQEMQLAHELLLGRFQRTANGGGVFTNECSMWISNSTDTGSYDGMDVFSINFRGTGGITQIFVAQPPIPSDAVQVKRYEFTGTEGQKTLTDDLLSGKEIIEFNKDGVSFSPIITSGTPVNKEVKYTTGTGFFQWGIASEAGEEFYILYQDT